MTKIDPLDWRWMSARRDSNILGLAEAGPVADGTSTLASSGEALGEATFDAMVRWAQSQAKAVDRPGEILVIADSRMMQMGMDIGRVYEMPMPNLSPFGPRNRKAMAISKTAWTKLASEAQSDGLVAHKIDPSDPLHGLNSIGGIPVREIC